MRFSSALAPTQPLRDTAAAELIRRILQAPALRELAPEPAFNPNLPLDLDQRVRATGEW